MRIAPKMKKTQLMRSTRTDPRPMKTLRTRARAVAAALVSWTFPVLVDDLATPLFAFFSVMMIVQLLFAWKLMPETRGLSLEEVEARLAPRPRDRGAARLAGAEAA